MNIVFSANTAWYLYNFRKNTIKKYIDQGHTVHIIAPKDFYTEKLISLGVTYHHIFLRSNSLNPFVDFITTLHLFFLYTNIRPDFVYNFTPKINVYSALVSYLFPSHRVVNNIAGLGTAFINNGFKKRLLHCLYKLSQKRANQIFFQNEEDMFYFITHGLVLKENSKRILGSGVDLNIFKVTESLRNTTTRFILVARLIEQKGVRLYAEAAKIIKKENPEAHFALLGPILPSNPSSISKEEIEKWADDGDITYLGQSDNVSNVLADYDCVVLPSFYREGVPKSLLEAAACGNIIITTNNIGCKDAVVDGVTGFLCEPQSLDSLVHALEMVLELSDEKFLLMKKLARKLAEEKFDENIIIEQYLDTLRIK